VDSQSTPSPLPVYSQSTPTESYPLDKWDSVGVDWESSGTQWEWTGTQWESSGSRLGVKWESSGSRLGAIDPVDLVILITALL